MKMEKIEVYESPEFVVLGGADTLVEYASGLWSECSCGRYWC